jgi:hypothetical protein
MSDTDAPKGFALATANMQAYQAKLLEIAQSNERFAFEFGLRLAAIKSPAEYFALITEFTSRRIDMFGQHAKKWLHIRSGASMADVEQRRQSVLIERPGACRLVPRDSLFLFVQPQVAAVVVRLPGASDQLRLDAQMTETELARAGRCFQTRRRPNSVTCIGREILAPKEIGIAS